MTKLNLHIWREIPYAMFLFLVFGDSFALRDSSSVSKFFHCFFKSSLSLFSAFTWAMNGFGIKKWKKYHDPTCARRSNARNNLLHTNTTYMNTILMDTSI